MTGWCRRCFSGSRSDLDHDRRRGAGRRMTDAPIDVRDTVRQIAHHSDVAAAARDVVVPLGIRRDTGAAASKTTTGGAHADPRDVFAGAGEGPPPERGSVIIRRWGRDLASGHLQDDRLIVMRRPDIATSRDRIPLQPNAVEVTDGHVEEGALAGGIGRRDLIRAAASRRSVRLGLVGRRHEDAYHRFTGTRDHRQRDRGGRDRKSTRLNSSHGYISYAVFCLKKKKI